MELTDSEKEYLDSQRLIFNSSIRYELNKKKNIIECKTSFYPSRELIRILRKKYDFPKGKFNIIYVDMPWAYNNKKTGGNHKSGSIQKYNVIPTDILRFELSVLINSIASDDAVIFMWLTVPMEREQMTVFDALDFNLKTKIFWHKTGKVTFHEESKTYQHGSGKLGMGYWVRHQVEILVMGVKGNIKAFRSSRRNLIETEFLAHSKKPEEFRKLIEDVTSSMKKKRKIELFARSHAKGWKSWGDQLGM